MTNKLILLLSIFLSSCQFRTVDFRKEGNFDVYVRLEAVEGDKTPSLIFVPLIKSDSNSFDFCFGEKYTLYRLSVLRYEDFKLLTETTLIPNEVKSVVLTPNSIRKEYRIEKSKRR